MTRVRCFSARYAAKTAKEGTLTKTEVKVPKNAGTGLRKRKAKALMVAKAGVRKEGVKVLKDVKTGLRKPGVKAKGSAKARVSAVASTGASSGSSEEPPISAKETARIVKGLDAARKQYPSNLEELRGQVEEAVKRVVQKSWHVDPIVTKVAERGLEEGYMQYAHEYKRKWAGKPAHKEFARREVLFGKSLLSAIQTNEAFHDTVLFMSGFFDYDEGEMFCSGHRGRKPVAQDVE